jgi:hypothetical protein
MASGGIMEGGFPADACGPICLTFRALAKLSAKNLANEFGDLEMNLYRDLLNWMKAFSGHLVKDQGLSLFP